MRRKWTKTSHNSKIIWTLFIAAKDKRTDKIKRTGIPSNMVLCQPWDCPQYESCWFYLLFPSAQGVFVFFSGFSNISRNSGAPSWERSSLSEISQWDLYCCLWLLRHNAAFSGTNCLNITDFLFHKAPLPTPPWVRPQLPMKRDWRRAG